MKVSKVGPTGGPDAARRKAKAGDGKFADALRETGDVASSPGPQSTQSVGGVDGVFAVQANADATDHRSRGLVVGYGNDLLNRLEQIRLGLLVGRISKERLQEMARRLREKRQTSDDPRLEELIKEIELRAEVEIAKLTR